MKIRRTWHCLLIKDWEKSFGRQDGEGGKQKRLKTVAKRAETGSQINGTWRQD